LNTEKTTELQVNDKTHITSVVLDSDHVVLVDRWIAEIVGGTKVEEWRKEDAVCSKSAAGIFKKSESIRRKFKQPQKCHKRFRKLEYKLSVSLKGRKIESEGEMGGVRVASQPRKIGSGLTRNAYTPHLAL